MKNNKGITLMVLVLTIIVLLILTSMISYTSYNLMNNAKLEVFTTELKIMQQEVNMLYQKAKTGDGTITIDGIDYYIIDNGKEGSNVLGKKLNPYSDDWATALRGVYGEDISDIDSNQFRYYDNETIEMLGLEGIKYEFLVNIKTRTVISLNGFKYDEKMYYTLQQIDDIPYNVEYENTL